jgi:hypothetical protein
MIKATLTRKYTPTQTLGELVIGTFKCKTLELAWKDNASKISCIPEGVYQVVPRHSAKYGRHLHITNVPNRSFVLIHWGNYAGSINPKTGQSDIKGCVLVGSAMADINKDGILDIVNSKPIFAGLMLMFPDGFELTIKS